MHVTDWFKANKPRLKGHHKQANQATLEALVAQKPAENAKAEDESKTESKDNKEEKKLKEIVKESHTTLAKAKAVFPFNFFPDLITIDQHKLSIVYRQFFGIKQTVSVPIENIKNIQADLGPFFGSITVTSDHFINNTQTVNYLTRYDAERIQKLVQGIMVAVKEGVDISKVENHELGELLTDLGRGRTEAMEH
jgi:hypothetical protein